MRLRDFIAPASGGRLLKSTCTAAALAGLLIGAASVSLAQQIDEVTELNKKIFELNNAGKYADAVPLAQQVLAIREKALGRDDPGVATSLNNLAELYADQGRYADAEPSYKRSLAIREKALGPDHPDVATSLNNLALLYQSQGRYADAEPLYQRALAIREKALGPDHPNVASSLNNLAGLYADQGRYADAEPLYKRSLAIWETTLGPDHPDVARSLTDLAELYRSEGRYADAEPLYQRSLVIREKALGRDHPNVASSLNNLALLYQSQGRYADAEPLYQRALAIWEKALRPDHPNVASSLNNLASLYQSEGRYADAEPLYQRSLAILEKALGPNHPDVASSLNNLANLYYKASRYVDAEPLYQRSLVIREKALGRDHPDVASSLYNLALLYQSQGRYTDAEPLYQRSLAIREKALGRDHPEVATSLSNLAQLYVMQGRYADAEPLYLRSLVIREKALGRDHPDVARSLTNLADLYQRQGRPAEGLPFIQQALQLNSNDARALETRARIREALEDFPNALADYKAALALDSELKESRDGQDRITTKLAALETNNATPPAAQTPAAPPAMAPAPPAARALGKRVALVIGNGAYHKAPKLNNPINDATAVAGMLKAAGFDIVEYRNLRFLELLRAIKIFSDMVRDADVAVVYFSGHGIEVDGTNYLIPIDAFLETDMDVPDETLSLERLLKFLEPAKRLRLVMLDACRDNPFARSMKRSASVRAVSRGFAPVEPTSANTLIAFAAKAGSYALDGEEGANSPYATAVLNNLATPGLDLRIAFGRVRDDVLKATNKRQEPYVYGSLGGEEIYIVPAVSAPLASPAQSTLPLVASRDSAERAERAWMMTKDTTSKAVLEDFIRYFADSFYASLARARLKELKENRVAAPR
jgi:tetratricopeptide (TPR) repeat protein